jgi:enamine deaminase RidA (YjgF/YER057c/UK114 family)
MPTPNRHGYDSVADARLARVLERAYVRVVTRELFSTGSAYEPLIGCSRAVRSKNHLSISATAPLAADGKTTAAPDPYGQAKRCLEIIAGVIQQAGFSLADVVKTRVYFKTQADWEAIAKAHGEVFGTIRPANAFIQVVGFASPEWHLEIEAECHRDQD